MDPIKTQKKTPLVSTIVQQTIVISESSAPDAASPEAADAGGTVNLGPDDLLIQNHVQTPRNVDVERAALVPDHDWEVGRPRRRSTKAAPRS